MLEILWRESSSNLVWPNLFFRLDKLPILFARQLLCFSIALILSLNPAWANVVALTQADVGSTGATSSYSYNSSTNTYTLSGAGAGIAAYADACSTAFVKN